MFTDEVLEKLFSNEEIQKLPVGTQSTVVKSFQEVIEDLKEEHPYAELSSILSTNE